MFQLNLSDTFNKALPADTDTSNSRRQVYEACYSFVEPKKPTDPKLLHVSQEMLEAIGLNKDDVETPDFLKIFSGAEVYPQTSSYAMCYGGHQFGHWAGQLGDGRAINLMEVVHEGQRWALQLKGAGPTPYSRRADGLAVLRSSIREHLCSEAMYHLGIPTTRSLSLMLSGDQVLRDVMYNGNAAYEKGAIVCRVAPSFVRFGNLQIFASRNDKKTLQELTDYTIEHFFPEVEGEGADRYLSFFNAVVDRSVEMVVHWQRVGFVHGVMNTDNMSILGLTIDYGPYGWLEGYDPDWTPNTTDRREARYRFGNQPSVLLWNLFQLANTLFPLIESAAPLEAALERYKQKYLLLYGEMMRSKLGLLKREKEDLALIESLENSLQLTETDMTIFFRLLSEVKKKETAEEMLDHLSAAFYQIEEVKGSVKEQWLAWFNVYRSRLHLEQRSDEERSVEMKRVNPKYVLRNYMAQLAIDAADEGDYTIIEELYQLLKQPYAEQSTSEKWFAKRPEWARHKVGCSMLSCSS